MLDALISAGTKLLGGYLTDESNAKQQEANRAYQREFAQSGIQWKVEDAKKAGVHPLAALGAPTISPAVSVQPSGMGAAVSSMGQDISRAVAANSSQDARDAVFSETVRQLELQNMTLKNDYLASQLQKLKQGGSMPSMPAPGRTNANEPPPGGLTQISLKNEPSARLVMGGEEVRQDRAWSPASAVEDRYGESVSDWVYGPLVLYMDWVNHNRPVWEANRKVNRSQKEQRYGARPAGRNY